MSTGKVGVPVHHTCSGLRGPFSFILDGSDTEVISNDEAPPLISTMAHIPPLGAPPRCGSVQVTSVLFIPWVWVPQDELPSGAMLTGFGICVRIPSRV
jgi:hypothetical protein